MKINLTFGIRIYDLLKHQKCSKKDPLHHSVPAPLKENGTESLKKVNSVKNGAFFTLKNIKKRNFFSNFACFLCKLKNETVKDYQKYHEP